LKDGTVQIFGDKLEQIKKKTLEELDGPSMWHICETEVHKGVWW